MLHSFLSRTYESIFFARRLGGDQVGASFSSGRPFVWAIWRTRLGGVGRGLFPFSSNDRPRHGFFCDKADWRAEDSHGDEIAVAPPSLVSFDPPFSTSIFSFFFFLSRPFAAPDCNTLFSNGKVARLSACRSQIAL